VNISNVHNIARNAAESRSGCFGIRVSAPAHDPFLKLVEDDWCRMHWFMTKTDRDTALSDMRRRHVYSRDSDQPSLVFEAVERPDDERD